MAIGRTFPESLQKALRSLEQGRLGLNCDPAVGASRRADRRRTARAGSDPDPRPHLPGRRTAAPRRPDRHGPRGDADRSVVPRPDVDDRRGARGRWRRRASTPMTTRGMAARQASRVLRRPARPPVGLDRGRRRAPPANAAGVIPTYKTVDTCAAEFAAETPYHYSTYEDESEVRSSTGRKVVILGSGPNRIGQGIEFDYCCVHASLRPARGRLRDDHDQLQPRDGVDRLRHVATACTSSRSRKEDVLNVIAAEQPVQR